MLSIETIQRVANRHGFTFGIDSCLNLLEGSFEGETIREALTDYLNAYEGVSDKRIEQIWNDPEGELTA